MIDTKKGVSALFSVGYTRFSENLNYFRFFSLFLRNLPHNFSIINTLQALVSGCPTRGYRLTNGL
jgi:hypothetical protein